MNQIADLTPLSSFEPEETGRELPGPLLAHWLEFCGKVRREYPALYDTWFENREGKARGWGIGHADMSDWRVSAGPTANNRGIVIRCPGNKGAWARKMADLLSNEFRGFTNLHIEASSMGARHAVDRRHFNGEKNAQGQTFINGEWYPLTDEAMRNWRAGLAMIDKRRNDKGELNAQDRYLHGLGMAALERHDAMLKRKPSPV